MNVVLENGFNSLIAYYFRMTNFPFLDEYDLKILVDIANMSGIKLNTNANQYISEEIFSQFLNKLDEFVEGTWAKGIIGKTNLSWTYSCEERDSKRIRRLEFYDRFIDAYYDKHACMHKYRFEPKLLVFLNQMMGTDAEVLISKMPNPDTLKKFMTLKKIVLCKTPYNDNFYNNIPSNEYYDSFDDWSRDVETRGIYPQTYDFIEFVEQSILQNNQSTVEENSIKSTPKTLTRIPT